MKAPNTAWRLVYDSDRFLSLIPHDLTYFHTYFAGHPIASPWQPPPISIVGKSKRLPDFVGWALCAPIITERARLSLESLIGTDAQLLPFHRLRGKPSYAVNVLTSLRISDVLDETSKLHYFRDGTLMKVSAAVFRANFVLPHIFKLDDLGHVWVSDTFAKLAIESGLTGARFLSSTQDPAKFALGIGPISEYVMSGKHDA